MLVASTAPTSLTKDRTVALISCMGTANNQRIMPLVDEAQIPYVAPQSGAVSLRKAEYLAHMGEAAIANPHPVRRDKIVGV